MVPQYALEFTVYFPFSPGGDLDQMKVLREQVPADTLKVLAKSGELS